MAEANNMHQGMTFPADPTIADDGNWQERFAKTLANQIAERGRSAIEAFMKVSSDTIMSTKCSCDSCDSDAINAEAAIDNCWLVYEGSEAVRHVAWIPVGVELPEYGKDVFCVVENCYESGCVVMRRLKGSGGDVWEIACDMFETEPSSRSVAGAVTHWMPMPRRPGG